MEAEPFFISRIEPSVVRTGVVELGGNVWDDETDVGIAQIIKHPEYTRKEKYHDLTLLRSATSSNLIEHNRTAMLCIFSTNHAVTNEPTSMLGRDTHVVTWINMSDAEGLC